MKKHIAILGSTGSIGTQAIEVCRAHPHQFQIEVLTANTNHHLLIKQAMEVKPNAVVIGDSSLYHEVNEALSKHNIKVYSGIDSIWQVVTMDVIDTVLTAMVGYAGLLPTIKAIESKKNIALANKETLVVAGALINKLAQENGVNIYPVDSEHSAIFQCMAGEWHNKIEKIYLTASGGPFRGCDISFLQNVTPAQALKHPTWSMGSKISIDSASMMNKGLEMIEAQWLFHLMPEQIDVIVHPQSIIHSIVQFEDGSMKAQMGLPDMKLPILYALGYPHRFKTDFPRFNFLHHTQLTFENVDRSVFKNLAHADHAMRKGGNMPCVVNAANEIAVEAFLREKIKFTSMPDLIEACMYKVNHIPNPVFDDYVATDKETRDFALSLL